MRSPGLESIKRKYPNLSRRIEDLATYIGEQIKRGRRDVVPVLAASSLHTTEAEILGLLMLFDKEGLVRPAYKIYCADKRTLLKTVYNKRDIPTVVYCNVCGREHVDPDELEIQLVFEVKPEAW